MGGLEEVICRVSVRRRSRNGFRGIVEEKSWR